MHGSEGFQYMTSIQAGCLEGTYCRNGIINIVKCRQTYLDLLSCGFAGIGRKLDLNGGAICRELIYRSNCDVRFRSLISALRTVEVSEVCISMEVIFILSAALDAVLGI